MYCWRSTCDFQARPPWFAPKRCGRTATRVESSWWPKIICPHLTNPNSARCEMCQNEEEWTHLYISQCFMKRLFYFFFFFRLWTWTAATSSCAQMTFISSMESRCGPGMRWEQILSCRKKCFVPLFVQRNMFFVFVCQVVSVNVTDKTVQLHDGALQPYSQLLISTGCRLETLSCSSCFFDLFCWLFFCRGWFFITKKCLLQGIHCFSEAASPLPVLLCGLHEWLTVKHQFHVFENCFHQSSGVLCNQQT